MSELPLHVGVLTYLRRRPGGRALPVMSWIIAARVSVKKLKLVPDV
jgi:hypothetical protein